VRLPSWYGLSEGDVVHQPVIKSISIEHRAFSMQCLATVSWSVEVPLDGSPGGTRVVRQNRVFSVQDLEPA
jgi:hypothetical protein